MRLTLATYFLTLGVSLFYVVCARPALITESLKSLSLQPRNPTQALQPHSSTLRISLYPPGNPDDPDNSSKFNSRKEQKPICAESYHPISPPNAISSSRRFGPYSCCLAKLLAPKK
ncbi:uncharacterized protein C8R40DRAFT_280704 [Lentinula edodes]|uniref:uncharacterized protein n=1 Tax=Lentinula edodes TaxID=5353 RepID=UPI001E8E85F8|nr:uncharacterized protein C8R40DRAFT_280704 [Lentinula edodes]KAH7880759.1 hypothetical protein C8R40DRAFT_280704 [Lentinula edodes]